MITSLQVVSVERHVATTLNAIDGFLLTARVVRDRVTNLLKTLSA